jgi:hypothetical protein
MKVNKLRLALFAPIQLALSAFIWFHAQSTTAPAKKTEIVQHKSSQTSTTPRPSAHASSSVTTLDPLANLDPFATLALNRDPLAFARNANSIQTLRELQRGKTLAEAQAAAAMSDDPVVHVNSLHMMFPCIWEPVQLATKTPHQYLQQLSSDSKTGLPKPLDEAELQFVALRASGGPQRLHYSAPLRERLQKLSEEATQRHASEETTRRDIPAEMRVWAETRASLSLTEAAAFATVRDHLVSACDEKLIGSDFGAVYRAQREKLAGNGVLSALIFNESAGWASRRTLSELTERDFALVERAFREQHPDVFALLLLRGHVFSSTELITFSEEAQVAKMVVGYEIPKLAACALNVADCSPSGFIFQEACLNFGGCDQPDAFALWRYVLARDGLDPSVIDRVVADLVAKIRAGDLEALRIRRKK